MEVNSWLLLKRVTRNSRSHDYYKPSRHHDWDRWKISRILHFWRLKYDIEASTFNAKKSSSHINLLNGTATIRGIHEPIQQFLGTFKNQSKKTESVCAHLRIFPSFLSSNGNSSRKPKEETMSCLPESPKIHAVPTVDSRRIKEYPYW